MDELENVLFGSEYAKGILALNSGLKKNVDLAEQFYNLEFEKDFNLLFESKEFKIKYDLVKRQASEMALDSLSKDSMAQAIIVPLRQTILNQVISGGEYKALQKVITEYIDGGEGLDPKLKRYVNQNIRDSYVTADRTYANLINQELKAKYYYYSGNTVADSRQFCVTRHNRAYTTAEVESWAKLGDWQGRRQGTNSATIFIYCGGYNCRHNLIPISENRYKSFNDGSK
jgi:hypothetical protein